MHYYLLLTRNGSLLILRQYPNGFLCLSLPIEWALSQNKKSRGNPARPRAPQSRRAVQLCSVVLAVLGRARRADTITAVLISGRGRDGPLSALGERRVPVA